MIRFIWQNWWRRKERFILLLIGAFIVSAGLTYLIGLSETNKGTAVDTLQQRWTASYDIVVRPEGSRSVTEDKKLLEPNYLSGISGGISVEQYETIKGITGIDVAAPIAMIGYAGYDVNFGEVELEEEGIYRRKIKTVVDNGVKELSDSRSYYFPYEVWDYINKIGYGIGKPEFDLSFTSYSLLAGIDPEQEAKLVGLDEAIVPLGSSRYFDDSDYTTSFDSLGNHIHEFPIIVNNSPLVDETTYFTYERLDLPIDDETADDVMETVKDKGASDYLDTLDGMDSQTFSFTGEEAFHEFVDSMTGVDWETGELVPETDGEVEKGDEAETNNDGEMNDEADVGEITGMIFQPSPLGYNTVSSPFADRWPYAYQVVPIQNDADAKGVFADQETYREPKFLAETFVEYPQISPNWIGFYDPSNLNISRDPTTELPMETYRPATAELVMDVDGEPVNPPQQLKPSNDPYDFLTNPPGMLTTIEAAEQIMGDEPISAIRVNVAGVTDLSEESQAKLEQVASEIEEKTGLITDITLGSSPQLALTYVPGLNDEDAVGWLQQPWVNIGSSISIFKETKVGFSAVVGSVIAVAIVYVWASGIVSLLARRKEFAVLLSVGWRPSQLSRLLFLESTILGLFVTMISWMMLSFVYISGDAMISLTRFVWTGLFGLIIYVLGACIPALITRNISPYEAMQTGEIAKTSKRLFQTRGLYSMAFNHFIGKWKRSLLSVFSISLPTALLALFLFITFRLRGIMYTTWLGEYVALEIGPVHYVAIMIALIIAILTTAEIMWQNVAERREEIALLQAVGWKGGRIRRLILTEGLWSGFFAALIGISLAFAMMWGLYGQFPGEELGFILSTGFIPLIIGMIGTIFPAERAVRITPTQGIGGNLSNRKAVEKRLKWVVITSSVLLVGGFLFAMVKVAPNIETAEDVETEQAFSPTEGDVGGEEQGDVDGDNGTDDDENSDDDTNSAAALTSDYVYVLDEGEVLDERLVEGMWEPRHLYSAEQVESNLSSTEKGIRNIAIEFTYEILNNGSYEMRPRMNFKLILGDEKYRPKKVNVLESTAWKDERWLLGVRDGKIHAILEFTVPDDGNNFDLEFTSRDLRDGFLVEFEN